MRAAQIFLRKNLLPLILGLIALVTFFYRLDYPAAMIFDETYHIPSAQKYLSGVAFQENHPPLGKLLIALGEKLWQKNAVNNQFVDVETVGEMEVDANFWGYRFFPALFGWGSVMVLYFVLFKLTKNRTVSFVIALSAIMDNAFLAQSRAAMLDSFLIFFFLLSLFLTWEIAQDNTRWRLAVLTILLGICLGSAALIKHTGLIAWWTMIFATWEVFRRRGWETAAIFLATIIISALSIYVSIWKLHYALIDKDGQRQVGSFWQVTVDQITEAMVFSRDYNRGVPRLDMCKPDEIGSPWYMWPLGGKAINYRWEEVSPGVYRYIYLIGNPVTWGLSILGVIGGTAYVVTSLFGLAKKRTSLVVIRPLVIIYWSYLLTFTMISRVMYLYHYLPGLFLGLVILGLLVNDWYQRRVSDKRYWKFLVIVGVVIVSIIYVFYRYMPLTYYEPIDRAEFDKLRVWPVWDLKPIGE